MGVSHLINVTCRDVCGKFDPAAGGFLGVGQHEADAVFLDLPEPWLAVKHAQFVLKPGRTVCSYSPCIEQVSQTCDQLRKCGFHSIRMMEVRQRPFDGRLMAIENLDVGRSDGKLRSADSVYKFCDGSSTDTNTNNNEKEAVESEILPDDSVAQQENNQANDEGEDEEEEVFCPSKKRKMPRDGAEGSESVEGTAGVKAAPKNRPFPHRNRFQPVVLPTRKMMIARPLSEMRGHTAFLTFAVAPTNPKCEDISSSSSNDPSSLCNTSSVTAST